MKEALLVHGAQPVQQALGEAAHLVGRQAPALLAQELGHAAAVLEFHDRIGRAVGLEVAQNRDDVDMAEPRQRARLVEKALAPPDEIVGKARPARRHGAVGPAHGELDGKVLLDGHELGELRVEGAVGDAKAAVPDDGIEAKIAQPRSERQSLVVFRGCGHAQPDVLDARSGADAQAPAAPPPPRTERPETAWRRRPTALEAVDRARTCLSTWPLLPEENVGITMN